MTRITITDKYSIRKIPLNYSIEKYTPEHIVEKGAHKGNLCKAKWKPIDSYHSSLVKALEALRNILVAEGLEEEETGAVILAEAIAILQLVDKQLITFLNSIKLEES